MSTRYKRALIAGGAGFVGSNLAIYLKKSGVSNEVIAFDNLRRKGSELAPERLKKSGVHFYHGDIRTASDILDLTPCDLILDCSAEPSVKAGYNESPSYLMDTNLVGSLNLLKAARHWQAVFILLSSSRVYPIEELHSIPLLEYRTRFDVEPQMYNIGYSYDGISEDFPIQGYRSLYGGTKLASEIIAEEFSAIYEIPVIINRCGVIAGPWQMGKVDQGFIALWIAKHIFGGKLSYIGFGGSGKQVRDVLHIDDLSSLLHTQLLSPEKFCGQSWNVGGGRKSNISLLELTELVESFTNNSISFDKIPASHQSDIPWYITDGTKIIKKSAWQPQNNTQNIVEDVTRWIVNNRYLLQPIFTG